MRGCTESDAYQREILFQILPAQCATLMCLPSQTLAYDGSGLPRHGAFTHAQPRNCQLSAHHRPSSPSSCLGAVASNKKTTTNIASTVHLPVGSLATTIAGEALHGRLCQCGKPIPGGAEAGHCRLLISHSRHCQCGTFTGEK